LIGLAILAGVMGIYWLVVLRVLPRGARRANWLLDRTLRRYRFDTFFGHFVSHGILLTWSLIVLAPIWTMLVNSLKDKRDIFRTPFDWPGGDAFTTAGYESAWVDGNFDVYFKNSLIVTVSSLLLILALGSLAAYALANWRGRGSSALYLYFVWR
jgi:ABC-type glycerol-3-phosphate transport system permease component